MDTFNTIAYKHAFIQIAHNRAAGKEVINVLLFPGYCKTGFNSIAAAKAFISRMELKQPIQVIIDVRTGSVDALIQRLQRLEWAFFVLDGGQYAQDYTYSQVHLESFKSVKAIDNWLYNYCRRIDYVGAVERGGA